MQEEDLGKGVFKKTNVNFESILQKQREIEEDEKFVISDSLQKFIDDTASQAGYQNQDKLDKAKIRPEIVNFVEGFTITNLDGLKGSDYDESVQLQKTTEKQHNKALLASWAHRSKRFSFVAMTTLRAVCVDRATLAIV